MSPIEHPALPQNRPSAQSPSMSHHLKILSGTLNGVEYALVGDDTIFYVGPHRALLEGRAAHLLGGVENAFYLPADLAESAFVVQVVDEAERTSLRVGERDSAGAPWAYRRVLEQTVICAAGIYFAVRADGQRWAQEILDFAPPAAPVATADPVIEVPVEANRLPREPRWRMRSTWLLGLGLAMVAVLAGWLHWRYTPEVRLQGLATVLRQAPGDYQILPGDDGKLYAFTDDRNGQAWGERASRRLQRRDDIYLLRSQEAARLERVLVDAGLPLVIIRLHEPVQPHVVLVGPVSNTQRERVQALVTQAAPYARRSALVSAVTDSALVAMAQDELRGLGISSRTEPHGARVSIINDVFLDDASLNAMAGMANRFHRRWGHRRITVHPQLWDDLLQGRSYRYSPAQLLSVGEGRWTYARPAGGRAPAAQ